MLAQATPSLAVARVFKKKPLQVHPAQLGLLLSWSPQQDDPCHNSASYGSLGAAHQSYLLEMPSISRQSVDSMHQHGLPLSRDITYLLVQRCTQQNDLIAGRQVHSLMLCSGLDALAVLGDHLIRLFALHGILLEASITFCKVADPSVYTWQAIISAYVRHGECARAVQLYESMRQEGVQPNKYIFSCILKACGNTRSLRQGELLHDQIIKSGHDSDVFVGSALIDMYANCDCLKEAHEVLVVLKSQDVVPWNAMIVGYVHCGHGLPALKLFEKMQQEGVQPGKITFSCVLKACSSVGAIREGKLIHDLIIQSEFESDAIISSTVINMYAKCGRLEEALAAFERLASRRTLVSWNAILAGCAQHGHTLLAFELFERMQQESISPDIISFCCVLGACGHNGEIMWGRFIHDEIVRNGLELHVVIGSTLIKLYAECGMLYEAQKVFDELSTPNLCSWCALIGGYTIHGHDERALELFERMQQMGFEPDKPLFLCALQACSNTGALEDGRLIHCQIVQSAVELDIAIGSTLIEMYANCGDLETAQMVLEELPNRDLVSWTALIAGYVERGHNVHALKAFEKSRLDDINPDEVMCAYILKACGDIGAIHQGNQILIDIIESGLDEGAIVSTALVEMYAQCGSLEDAYKVLMSKEMWNLVSWNAMIAGCAQHGNSNLARQCFEEMKKQGLKPDGRTFTSVLAACCHTGEVEQGLEVFRGMQNDHGITPSIEHVNCMVDLLGRAGCLIEAEALIQRVPILPDVAGWRSLLASSRKFGNPALGRHCQEEAAWLEADPSAGYMLLSNLYADLHMWDDVQEVQKLRTRIGAFKKPGRAWIEDHHNVHEFIVGDESHLQSNNMGVKSKRLERVLKDEGYLPQLQLSVGINA